MHIIIPSAKIVNEELQSIGKLPAIIYPVNKRIVFDYIYEQYKDLADSIDIICNEKSEKVHRRIGKNKDHRVHIHDLPKLDDLGHTIHYALGLNFDYSKGVLINFGDTIVMEKPEVLRKDSFFFSVDYISDIWTFFSISDGVITNLHDKSNEISNRIQKEKLFVGVFWLSDAMLLRESLEYAFMYKDEAISTFYKALQLYSKKIPLQAIYTDKWFDIGHMDKYYASTLEVKAREFNHISIDKNRGILRKTSDNVEKFIGEIKWYLKLPSDIEYVRPRIFDYDISYSSPYVSMEYYSYHTVHELFLYGDLNKKQWIDIFSKISFVCKDLKRYVLNDCSIQMDLEDMYLKKTMRRFEQMKKDERFVPFFENNIIVNENTYQSLNNIMIILNDAVPQMLYDVKKFYIIHGDLCFSNIMIDNNFTFIKVIDPRGKFGKYDIYGDFRYEIAKLFHSVDGKYDFIIKDLFNVTYDIDRRTVHYNIIDREREFDLYHIFIDEFKDEIGDDLKKIELIEALLFLSMIPLHNENFEHQMVMLATGLDILNRVVDITT